MRFNPRDIARAGRKVYERHKADFERRHQGIYLAASPEDAYLQVPAEDDVGPFHLMRVGDRAAFRSRRLHGVDSRVTR
jgi:hypothetical protein